MVGISRLSLVAGAALSPTVYAATAQSFASSLDNTLQLSPYTAPVLNGANTGGISSTWGLSFDDTSSGHKQTIDGFGAAVCHSLLQTSCTLTAG